MSCACSPTSFRTRSRPARMLGSVPLTPKALDDYRSIGGADDFYQVTKAMHNSLQGMYIDWTPEMRNIWLSHNRLNAELFDERYDFVVVHDPQPAAIPAILRELKMPSANSKWIWRCHIDLTEAQVQIWELL